MLEYLFIVVLLISEEKRSARRLASATGDDPIFTSRIVTFYQSKESEQTGCEIGTCSVAHARRRAERFSSDNKRTRINK